PADALESWGWRAAFILGGLFGLIGAALRSNLDESPLFKALRERAGSTPDVPAKQLFRKHLPSLVYVTGLGSYLGMIIILMYFYMPTLLQSQYHVELSVAFNANALALFTLAVCCPFWGYLADKAGAGWVLAVGALGIGAGVFELFQNLETISSDKS